MSNLFYQYGFDDNDFENKFYNNNINYFDMNLDEQEDMDSFGGGKSLENTNIANPHSLSLCFLEDKTTAYKTTPNLDYSQKEINEKNDKEFQFYKYETIFEILKKNINNSQINEKFVKDNNMEKEEEYLQFGHKKRKRNEDKENNQNESLKNKENNIIKRGRKKKNFENNKKENNKMENDNIIKKTKAIFFNYSLMFMNKLLENSVKDDNKLKLYKLDYKSINQLKKENDIALLNTPLKDFFSFNISPKYKFKDIDYNKELIKKIINMPEKVNDYNTIKFVLDLTFGDWLELFTYKKNVKKLIKSDDDYNVINFRKIEDSLVGINKLLEKKVQNFDSHYFSHFIFYIYNYERWFYIKKPRKYKH